MRKISFQIVILIFVMVFLFLSACEGEYGEKKELNDESWTAEGVNAIVLANNQFAFDLYSKFQEEAQNENIFFSPYSISTALTMVYEGAKGQTAEEMQSVLHLPEDTLLRQASSAKIYNDLNKEDEAYELSIANALWVQKEFPIVEGYSTTIEQYYGGEVKNLDFVNEPEKSREIVNAWIEEQTRGKITNVIPEGLFDQYTRLVLVNAIYFKGAWLKPFSEEETSDENFKISTEEVIKVPTMQLSGEEFNYAETDEVQILEMLYNGDDLSMLIILPKENNLEAIEEILNAEKLSEWNAMLSMQRVDIFIPTFKFETKYFMVKTLSDMGMPTAFLESADFTAMEDHPYEDLMIDEVIHQAFVEVNEEGTEAAAVTVVEMSTTTSEEPYVPVVEFRADHPFIFIIQQRETGNILFLGRVNNPIAQ